MKKILFLFLISISFFKLFAGKDKKQNIHPKKLANVYIRLHLLRMQAAMPTEAKRKLPSKYRLTPNSKRKTITILTKTKTKLEKEASSSELIELKKEARKKINTILKPTRKN